MKRFTIISTLIAPIALAWGIAGSVCGFWSPRAINCFHASDGYWEVYFSFAIMFCIATWVPIVLFALIAKTRRSDQP